MAEIDFGKVQFLKPRLRLFLSADIVGSTAFKHGRADDGFSSEHRTIWADLIQGFYFEAQKRFDEQFRLATARNESTKYCGPKPQLWKTIGDEILFTKEVTQSTQLHRTVEAWLAAIDIVRGWLKSKDSRLDVKCAAWVAGFPCKNAETVVDVGDSSVSSSTEDYFKLTGDILEKFYKKRRLDGVAIDFIGPSIDLGFRVSKFSTARKMVVCADTAYILALNSTAPDADRCGSLYIDQIVTLKGVNGGANYPIFWMDFAGKDSIDLMEDALFDRRPVNPKTIIDYCEAYYSANEPYAHKPFICDPDEQVIHERPPGYDIMLQDLVNKFKTSSPEVETSQKEVDAAAVGTELDVFELQSLPKENENDDC